MKIDLLADKKDHVQYSGRKDPIILFTAFDRQDNNKFIADMTNIIHGLYVHQIKVTPKNIAKHSKYNMKEIELNLYEIEQIMNTLGVD